MPTSRRGQAAVVATLYRSLARVAKQFDRDPALKALVSLYPSRAYNNEAQDWVKVDQESIRGFTALALDHLGGHLYAPSADRPESLSAYVRRKFREDVPGSGSASGRGGSSVLAVADIGSQLDAAFAALAQLTDVVAFSDVLPRTRYLRPAAPAAGKGVAAATGRADGRSKVLRAISTLPASVGGNSGSPPLLLAAHPMQLSSSFGRGVVLLTSHSARSSDGLVVNKPTSIRMRHASRLLDARVPASELGALARNRIYCGGPVAGPLMVVHPHTSLVGLAADEAGEWEYETEEEEESAAAAPLDTDPKWSSSAAQAGAVGEPGGARRATSSPAEAETEESEDLDSNLEGEVHLELAGGPVLIADADSPLYCSRVTRGWLRQANALVAQGHASALDFKLILGQSVWGPGQLRGEIEGGEWMATSLPAAELRDLALAQTKNAFGRGGKLEGAGAAEGTGRRVGLADALGDSIGRSEENILHQMREEGGCEQLNRSQRQVLLHMVLDEELVPAAGQREWGRVVGSLGGEFRSIATLASAQEEQCALLEEEEEQEDVFNAEFTYEEED